MFTDTRTLLIKQWVGLEKRLSTKGEVRSDQQCTWLSTLSSDNSTTYCFWNKLLKVGKCRI